MANISWAWKALRTKNIVLLTDKEAICEIRYVDPQNFKDTLLLSAQAGSLMAIRENLDLLIKEHDKLTADFTGVRMEISRDEDAPETGKK